MRWDWRDGNQVRLLENGEQFYPRVFEAIRAAEREVIIETFILFEDKVGLALHAALCEAARRGVSVDLTVDDYGSPDLSPAYVASLADAGVRLHIFDPVPRFLGLRTNLLHRLHRKLVVIDGVRAFIGGINYSADHLADFGPEAKQDYAVEIEGPVVSDIHRFALTALGPRPRPRRLWLRRPGPPVAQPADVTATGARVLFVTRDNDAHKNDIELHYLGAIRSARKRVVVANAYFFPGYRLLRALRLAALRGVKVRLIVQGQADIPLARIGARMLYNFLIRDGVEIHEYWRRPMHGKVALVDDEWATVGSSNLDPLSLSVNLEANVIIRDRAFNQHLYDRLDALVCEHCRPVRVETVVRGQMWRAPIVFLIFHFLRHFPRIASWLPRRPPRQAVLGPVVKTENDRVVRVPVDSAELLPVVSDVTLEPGATSSATLPAAAPARVAANTTATPKPGARGVWPLARRVLTYGFFALVAVLLVMFARNVAWHEVWATLADTPPSTLLLAGAVAAASHVLYASFDVLGKIYTRHHLPARQIMPLTFVCYAFNLNLSAWVGSIAFRYRLYSRLGLDAGTITKIFTLSVMTNWLGYLALAGTVFALGIADMGERWLIGPGALRVLGIVLLAVAAGYLALCGASKRRSFTVRRHEIGLPSLRLAVTQLVLGAANWMLMALIIHVLLLGRVAYPTVLGVLLVAAIAGVAAHIPAGLGVLEAVFVTALTPGLSQGSVLAALIGYRAVYYLLPLLVAAIVYLVLEARARKLRTRNDAGRDDGRHPAPPPLHGRPQPGLGH